MCTQFPQKLYPLPRLNKLPGILVSPLLLQVGEPSTASPGFSAVATIRLSYPPTSQNVTVKCTSTSSPAQVEFNPPSVKFVMGENTWSTGLSVKITGVDDMEYENKQNPTAPHTSNMSFSIVDPNENGFDVWYTSNLATRFAGSVPTVSIDIFDPEPGMLAPPQISAIRFDSSLTSLSIYFDSPTGNADTSLTSVLCNDYFIFSTGNEFGIGGTGVCSFPSSNELRVRLGYGSTIRPGKIVSLQSEIVVAKCQLYLGGGDGTTCLNKRRPCQGCNGPVALPYSGFTLSPVAIASFKGVLGFCDDLQIDLSASKGKGPFDWESVLFDTVSCPSEVNCIGVLNDPALNATVDTSRLRISLSRSNMVQRDANYVFKVTLRNVLHEKAEALVTVQLVADAVPTFVLAGSSQRTIRRTQDVSISVAQAKFPCGISAGQLRLDWTSLQGIRPVSTTTPFEAIEFGFHPNSTSEKHEISVRIRDPNQIKLYGNEMKSGFLYKITGTASLGGSSKIRSSSSVYVYVDFSPLVAIQSPPGSRTVGMDEPIILNGADSVDPDNTGVKVYMWSCQIDAASGGGSCPSVVNTLLSTANTSTVIMQGLLAPYKKYVFELKIAIQGQERISTPVTSTLDVQGGTPPIIALIGPTQTFPNPDKALLIQASVESKCCKGTRFACPEYLATWTADIDPSAPFLHDLYNQKPNFFLADPLATSSTNIAAGKRKYKIILAPNVLIAGSQYSFTLTITDECGTSVSTLPAVQINAPPSSGSCVVNPSSGTALETQFEFNAPGK